MIRPLYEIAKEIRSDWKPVHPTAKPYLEAMVKVNHFIKKCFNIDYNKYTLKYGGYTHLELEKKIEQVKKITGFEQVSVGEYVKDHYLWFKENVNYNKNDCCNLKFL
jgi:hypothetical protein